MGAEITAAQNLEAASEMARRYWAEAQRWKKMAETLTQEIAARDASADKYMEVHHGTVIFREGGRYGY